MPDLRRLHRLAPVLVVPALAASLAACGDDDVAARPELPTETPTLWNPCDALDATFVKKQLDVATTEEDGTATAPQCRFVPKKKGDAALELNYQQFPGTLDEFWEQMGEADDADVRTPTIAGADAARIVVSAEKDQLYVTGFVQNGFLFEVVNLVDPAPYDAALAVRGVEATLTALSAHAEKSRAGRQSASPMP